MVVYCRGEVLEIVDKGKGSESLESRLDPMTHLTDAIYPRGSDLRYLAGSFSEQDSRKCFRYSWLNMHDSRGE